MKCFRIFFFSVGLRSRPISARAPPSVNRPRKVCKVKSWPPLQTLSGRMSYVVKQICRTAIFVDRLALWLPFVDSYRTFLHTSKLAMGEFGNAEDSELAEAIRMQKRLLEAY